MNIALISPGIYPCCTGGMEIFNYYLIKELATRGHTIWVLTYCDYDWKDKNINNMKLWRRFLILIDPSTIFHILLKLKKIAKQIDIVHVPYTSNSKLPYVMLFAKKFFNLSYIIYIHGGGMHPWKRQKLQKKSFENADDIISVSDIIKKEYEKRIKRTIKVIPPLIPFKKSRIQKNKLKKKYDFSYDDIIILSLGSIKKIKGSDVLLNAFLNLGKEYVTKNNLILLYVGDGAMKSSLEKIVEKKSFNENVKFFGNVPYEKVPEMYELADIYVIPSLFEGTPKSLLEAMYNGLPVIGSNTRGINNKIIDGENGLLFKLRDSNDLKEKIKLLVENLDLRKIGLKGKEIIEKNCRFDNTVDDFVDVYKQVIKNF